VGINKYQMEEPPPKNLLRIDMAVGVKEAEKLKKLRAERDNAAWQSALDRLHTATEGGENVMPAVIDAVKAQATVGEICDVWRDIFGEYRPKEYV
jgi:methylmalonyl-CoA mutase N-terminal domain/subunit